MLALQTYTSPLPRVNQLQAPSPPLLQKMTRALPSILLPLAWPRHNPNPLYRSQGLTWPQCPVWSLQQAKKALKLQVQPLGMSLGNRSMLRRTSYSNLTYDLVTRMGRISLGARASSCKIRVGFFFHPSSILWVLEDIVIYIVMCFPGEEPLDLSGVHSLAMVWKNHEKSVPYVVVHSKEVMVRISILLISLSGWFILA